MSILATAFLAALSLSRPCLIEEPQEVSADRAAYDALEKEFDALEKSFYDELKGAKTAEERQKVAASKRPDAEAFIPRFREVAERHPRTDGAARSLAWIVLHADGTEKRDSMLRLLDDHVQHEVLGKLCYDISFDSARWVGESLERIGREASSTEVQGKAWFGLANHLQRAARTARRMQEPGGKSIESLAYLKHVDPAVLERRAEEIYEQIVRDYPDVKMFRSTLGDMARGTLFELREFSIGKVAPDIVGEDIDGVSFKLSDYRGKVVVLDFWGHW